MKLFLDWETKDPYISLGYGPGWVFALRGYKNPEFKLLGCSVRTEVDSYSTYIRDWSELVGIIAGADIIVNHNCMYDIGCCLFLFQELGIEWTNYKNTIFHDTMLMAKLIDQDQFSYSLDNCSKQYGGVEKSKQTLTDYVWNSGIYQKWYKDRHNRNSHKRPDERKLFEVAIQNLDILPEEIVAEYCNYDVDATFDLYSTLHQKLVSFGDRFKLDDYSDLIKACVDIKRYGVRIDLEQAHKSKDLLEGYTKELLGNIYKITNCEFNINSSVQVVEALKSAGVCDFAKTEKGNDSANKTWLEEQPQEICKNIVRARNYQKLCNDFIQKLIDYQQIHIDNGSNDYRVFPNFNIFGATKTGRMSSSGYRKDSMELNFQQIPKRGEDKEAAQYVRSIFIPEENEIWIGADYSNQEQRLQVEFANRFGLSSSKLIMNKLLENPYLSFHKVVADICGVEKDTAKSINLGLSYSMGQAKLCKSLGLSTKWVTTKYGIREVAGKEGEEILNKYYKYFPFMKELQLIASKALTDDGFITTLSGRRLNLDKPFWNGKEMKTFEYKGLSKLVQGSAADVTMKALINCYREGLRVLLVVHDEICISSKPSGKFNENEKLLKHCMENTYKFEVPMVVELSEGDSWAA